MVKAAPVFILSLYLFLSACAVTTPVKHYYKLDEYSCQRVADKPAPTSILVTQPEAAAGYETEQMRYIVKPFELSAYAHNAWVGPPATLLFPLITQSLQYSGYFSAVSASPYADKADYRLDIQLIELHQNFLARPSTVELVVKAVLSNVDENRVVASRIISERIPCPQDTFYGGVLAANQAAKHLTALLTEFVIRQIKHDKPMSGTIAQRQKKLYNEPPSKTFKPTHIS
ncbi:ABC-type transport auxiliary lipoprotein family protein [Legionella londiniensis]|uniref:Transport protein n=1 Tax=Legionella londiniensis TaxID=45068 RepID=A0A0W0VPU7_9GAMM|nr:ABC-type transport auxiliary lipoprotein family protein [Legionella londiniensis]KTD21965.1 transport protein [Legionella londiniensis]STX94007.1 ABC transporter auxiliary component [Legionella londiniensis]